MRYRNVIALLLMFWSLTVAAAAQAADSSQVKKPPLVSGIWWTGSIGYGKSITGSGLGNAGALNVAIRDKYLLTVRASKCHGYYLPSEKNQELLEMTQDVAVMYGARTTENPNAWASISAGLSYVKTIRRGRLIAEGVNHGWFDDWYWQEHEIIRKSSIGIPVEAQAVFTPLPAIGVGLTVFGNLNLNRSYVAYGVNFLFGWMR